jgi:WD40 repeat protein
MRTGWLAAWSLLLILPASEAVAAAGPPLVRDLHGDPLPAGARARLGARRWRVGADFVLSGDGRLLASSDQCGEVRLELVATGRPSRRLRLIGRPLDPAAFSPDGRLLVTRDRESDIRRVWRVSTGQQVCVLKLGLGKPELPDPPPAFVPGGRKLVTWDREERRLVFWDLRTGKALHAERCPGPAPWRGVFSPDGAFYLARPAEECVVLRDLRTGRWHRIRLPATPRLRFHSWSPDSRLLAFTGIDDRSLVLFDVKTGRKRQTFFSPTYEVSGANFSQNGLRMLLPKGKGIDIRDILWGEVQAVANVALADDGWFPHVFQTDERSLLLVTRGAVEGSGFVRVIDARTGKDLDRREGHRTEVTALAFTVDGRTLVSLGNDGTIRRWDTGTARQRSRAAAPSDLGELSVSADGRLAAVSWLQQMYVSLVDLHRGRSVRTRQNYVLTRDNSRALALPPQPAPCSLSADGALLTVGKCGVVTGDDIGCIEVRRTADDGLLHALKLPPEGPHAFSPTGQALAVAVNREQGADVEVFDLRTGKSRRRIAVPRPGPGGLLLLGWSPDGRTLAAADGGHVFSWEAASGGLLEVASLPRKVHPAQLAVTADARVVVAGPRALEEQGFPICVPSDRRRAAWVVWDLGARRVVLATHPARPCCRPEAQRIAALSADGRLLAVAQADSSILLYELPLPAGRKVAPAGSTDLPRLWADLASGDARRGRRAEDALAASGRRAVEWLAGRLTPAAEKDHARLLADLDATDYGVREAATKQLALALERDGRDVEEALRDLVKRKPSPEAARRAERLLRTHAGRPVKHTPDELRQIRSVAVLERVGGPEATALLKKLAGGAPAVLTVEARAALKRLRRP